MLLASSHVRNGVVLASSWEPSEELFCGRARERHHSRPRTTEARTAEEQETDRAVLPDLRRTAEVLRETAKNFEDTTEQDWPDSDSNTTAENAEASQDSPSRFVRKTLPAKVDETHPRLAGTC